MSYIVTDGNLEHMRFKHYRPIMSQTFTNLTHDIGTPSYLKLYPESHIYHLEIMKSSPKMTCVTVLTSAFYVTAFPYSYPRAPTSNSPLPDISKSSPLNPHYLLHARPVASHGNSADADRYQAGVAMTSLSRRRDVTERPISTRVVTRA